MTVISIKNQTIALAALHQAAALVQEVATRGTADQDQLATCVGSILKIDSDSAISIYGSTDNLHLGLEKLEQQLSGRNNLDPMLMRYTTALIYLEAALSKLPDMQKTITAGIEKTISQTEMFPLLHENIIASLGDIYENTISTLQPRVIVNGEEVYLTTPHNKNKIRALLLSGIRAALLWRQCGGSRWKIIFQRKKITNT
ncbi:MAG: lysogenization regulator HflD, partial [Gammaproteobacteria bacterium]